MDENLSVEPVSNEEKIFILVANHPFKHGRDYGKMAGEHGLDILSDTTTREILPKLVKEGRLVEMSDPENKRAKRYYPPETEELVTDQLVTSGDLISSTCNRWYNYNDSNGISHLQEQPMDKRFDVYMFRIHKALTGISQIALAVAFNGPHSPMYAKERARAQTALTSVIETIKKDPDYDRILPLVKAKLFGLGPDTSKINWASLFS